MSGISKFSGILVAIASTFGVVQAAEPTGTLTLACHGTATSQTTTGTFDPITNTISMGLIVNFTNHTIQGTSRWGPFLFDDQLQITDSNENTVVFGGFSKFLGMTVRGSMDRVTGDVSMRATAPLGKEHLDIADYSLKCRPTQRMF